MKYPFSIVFLIFFLVPLSSGAQVQGRIVDAENGEPIPYAHIYLRSSGEGTASSIDGYFRLVVPDKRDTLRVTCLGYQPFILPISQSSDVPAGIRLHPSSMILDEVVLNASGPDAGDIMRKAIDRYITNYGVDDYNLKTFMRTTMQCDGKYVHLSEADGWVYDGGAPSWKAASTMKYVDWTQFFVQNEVRLSDKKYLLKEKWYNPAGLISKMLIWEADNYDYSLEAIQSTGEDNILYTIRAKASKKFKLKRKTWGYYGGRTWYGQRFNLMDRIFVIRAKDYAVLEVRMAERYPKKKDGIQTRAKHRKQTYFIDSVSYVVKYDVTPSGIYRPYYTGRYYEYTDTGLEEYPISPLQLTEKYEMFFSAYDTSGCTIEDLSKRYHNYRPYERTKIGVRLVYDNDSTSYVVRRVLAGTPSYFQLNHGYVVWGKPKYRPEYWYGREKTFPPYQDKEKLFADLSSLRPVAEQFADFTPRSEDTAQRMLELYGDDPYVRSVMERQIATMKDRYRELFDPKRDY